ncbi:MAG: glycerol-3-phosphate dehydrogenase [Acidimicrobiia bacterium]|nr:glycerol-3-phosphate dehydrogenase [Acidimicrobiia bacterium]
MREGSLEAPVRRPIPWREADFWDEAKLDAETRRVFDICHGCRRCFNLCDSFPRLFDLVDAAPSEELDTVKSSDFAKVVEACTLCDMCFLTKCPYVPPHEFDLDFPHLMLRHRAVAAKKGQVSFGARQITETDRNGRMGCSMSGLANWASRRGNALTRPAMAAVLGVHPDADLPTFDSETLEAQAKRLNFARNADAPAAKAGRKAAVFATCFANYNATAIGRAALEVLAKNGVETELVYPGCCGMPQLEQGDIARVAEKAKSIAAAFKPWIAKGYDVVALTPSCALMLKFEWPLIVPDDEDVKTLANATFDASEYVVDIARRHGLAPGLKPLAGEIFLHISCHSRAQNMGQKATEMLRLIPEAKIHVAERCSGHGGSLGVMKETFEVALKVGRPVARQAAERKAAFVVSECPLARDHIVQGAERLDAASKPAATARHPIEILARAYGG